MLKTDELRTEGLKVTEGSCWRNATPEEGLVPLGYTAQGQVLSLEPYMVPPIGAWLSSIKV